MKVCHNTHAVSKLSAQLAQLLEGWTYTSPHRTSMSFDRFRRYAAQEADYRALLPLVRIRSGTVIFTLLAQRHVSCQRCTATCSRDFLSEIMWPYRTMPRTRWFHSPRYFGGTKITPRTWRYCNCKAFIWLIPVFWKYDKLTPMALSYGEGFLKNNSSENLSNS